jgi:hypothetical protein
MTVVTSVPVMSKGGMKEAPVIRCLQGPVRLVFC